VGIKLKNAMEIWLGAYLRQWLTRLAGTRKQAPKLAFFAVADHYEPYREKADRKTAMNRLAAWEKGLPQLCRDLYDAKGRSPQHTFFYPLDEYSPEVLDRLADLCSLGLGDVEVHLHHEGESSAQLEDMLSRFAETLHDKHGLLRRNPVSGRPTYGFIHGNWSLDNSRPDGLWCGVNDELLVLKKSGCYADFTLPSAPSPCQTSTINSIYYAVDNPQEPKSHNSGVAARVGGEPSGDLLMVQGVLALDWMHRKYRVLPHLENSDLGAHRPPRLDRVPLWLNFAPAVQGAEDICFIKLHCHGAWEAHFEALMGPQMRTLLEYLLHQCPKEYGCEFRFVTCWEMVQLIHALERGEEIK
jgi:hypothetical protein